MKFPHAQPSIVGTVITEAGLRCLVRKKSAADVIEVRGDALLAENAPVKKIEAALQSRKQPVLLTLRIPAEGGRLISTNAERRELYLRLLPCIDAIDIELATMTEMKSVIEEARRLNKTLVLSAHAITKPATPVQYARWLEQCPAQPRTILKVASQIKNWRDLQQLAALVVNNPGRAIAVMGIGPYAAQSRLVLAALGSRLVYGYVDQPAAPGQPSADDVRKMVVAVRNLDG